MTDPDDDRRRRLVARGWRETLPRGLFEEMRWRSPAGRLLTEEEAFRELEVQEMHHDRETLP